MNLTKTPPTAKKVPSSSYGYSDEYFWLRDSSWPEIKNPKIIDYLEEENLYADSFFYQHKDKLESLYDEMRERIEIDYQSAPIKIGKYIHYYKQLASDQYKKYYRKKDCPNSEEEMILDHNILSKNKLFFEIGKIVPSPDNKYLAFSYDNEGSERYKIKIKNLATGEILDKVIENTLGNIVWSQNSHGFFFGELNQYWRTEKIVFYNITTDQTNLIYKELDEKFHTGIEAASSGEYLFINIRNGQSNEVRILDIRDNVITNNTPQIISSRRNGHKYSCEHHKEEIYIRSNRNSQNFELFKTRIISLDESNWELYKEETDSNLENFNVSSQYLILTYSKNTKKLIKAINIDSKEEHIIAFDEEVFEAETYTANFKENHIYINYSSLKTPNIVYKYLYKENKLEILAQQEIGSSFTPEKYHIERQWAETGDTKEKIPITIFYNKNLVKFDGKNPLYITGYGSYGISYPTSFRASILSLVDRGFIYAIAHVRGGSEMGYEWYKSAKFLNKKRTFLDFISATEYLIEKNYTSKGKVSVSGGSAGGLLVGALINMAPEYFSCAIANVPFVDVLNTMMDESLPLTPGEFLEWGNPKEKEFFEYIKSYCPYMNVKKQNYPHIYATAALNDPRVGYWEAAKWIAKIRQYNENNHIYLNTNMDQGHSGASGKLDYLKEIAKEFLFVIHFGN